MSTSILNTYPVFVDNQVLSSSQLNQLATYLDQQTRLTRTRLIGIGIVCGLEPFYDKTSPNGPYVTISEGKGVTSEGYMISIADTVCDRIREYTLPPDMNYTPFQLAGQQDVKLWELMSTDYAAQPSDTLYKLSSLPIAGNPPLSMTSNQFIEGISAGDRKVVILLLECSDRDLKSCLGRACDEFGKDRTFVVRKLLISVNDLITKVLPRTGRPDLQFPDRFSMPEIVIPRVLIDPATPPSTEYGAFSQAYANAVRVVYLDLIAQLRNTYSIFRPLLEDVYGPNNPFNILPVNGPADWNSLLNGVRIGSGPNYLGIQYFYDFIKDLILAYREFRTTSFELMSGCCLSTGLFPKHLVLGEAAAVQIGRPSEYRNFFIAAPVTAEQREAREKLIMLHKRMVLMVENFNLDTINNPGTSLNVRITPSFEKHSLLSARAIPYYYDINADNSQQWRLEGHWRYDLIREARRDPSGNFPVLAYENQDPNPNAAMTDPITTPLYYDTDPFDFFRIEGHLRRTVADASSQIEFLRKKFDLPFNLVTLRLKGQATTNELLKRCHFDDLRSQYIADRNEMACKLQRIFDHYYVTDTAGNVTIRPSSLFEQALNTDISSVLGNSSVAFTPATPTATLTNTSTTTSGNTSTERVFTVSTPVNNFVLPEVNPYVARKTTAINSSIQATMNALKTLLSTMLTTQLTTSLDSFVYAVYSTPRRVSAVSTPVSVTSSSSSAVLTSSSSTAEAAKAVNLSAVDVAYQEKAALLKANGDLLALEKLNAEYAATTRLSATTDKVLANTVAAPAAATTTTAAAITPVNLATVSNLSISTRSVLTGGFIKTYLDAMQQLINLKTRINEYVDQVTHNTKSRFNAEFYMTFGQLVAEEMRWIDGLLNDCTFRRLEADYYHLQYRLNYLKQNDPSLLSNFIKNNPGTQHMAGVPVGGTFILVYPGDPLSFDVQTRDQVQQQISLIQELEIKRADFSTRSDLTEAESLHFDSVKSRLCQLYEAQVQSLTLSSSTANDVVVQQPTVPIQNFNIDANQVIADFALPYLSNCDCVCEDIPSPTVTQLSIPVLAIPAYYEYQPGDYAFANDVIASSNQGCSTSPASVYIPIDKHIIYDERDGGQIFVQFVRNGDVRHTATYSTIDTIPTDKGGSVSTSYLTNTNNSIQGFRYTPPKNFTGTDSFEFVVELRRYANSQSVVLRSNKAKVTVVVSKLCPPVATDVVAIEVDQDLLRAE